MFLKVMRVLLVNKIAPSSLDGAHIRHVDGLSDGRQE
jgi:hypothetical protein